ncbi:10239_t:CDS:2 [Ambispora leptoticha]|uniref:10239_t:CDS:1 n=1 Tax=Ambispora leptoticha TaxID=144679 RepID=A0A9N9D8L5_9GLOM|nr:10239_t:CDS:2 [Ambispora leptoticha]
MDVYRELRVIGDCSMNQPQLSFMYKDSWDNQPEYVRNAYHHIAASAGILYKRMIQKRRQQRQKVLILKVNLKIFLSKYDENRNSTIEESSNLTIFGQPEISSNKTLHADLQESCLEGDQSTYFDSSSGDINFVLMSSENYMQSSSFESFDNRNYEFHFDNPFSSTSNNLAKPQQPDQ